MVPGRDYSVRSILHIAWRLKIGLVVMSALGVGLALAYTSRLPVLYRSEATILVMPQLVPQNYVRPTVNQDIDAQVRSLADLVLDRQRLGTLVGQLTPLFGDPPPETEALVQMVRAGVSVQIIRADAFRVGFVHPNPVVAARVTALLSKSFVDENLQSRTGLAEASDQFIESQLDNVRARLTEHEQRLEEYRRTYAGELPSQLPANLQVLQSAQQQLQALRQDIQADRDRRLQIEQTLAALSEEAPAEPPPAADAADVDTSALLTDEALAADGEDAVRLLAAAKAAQRRLQSRLKPDHPDMVRLERVIASLEQRVGAAPDAAAPPSTPPATDGTRARLLNEAEVIDQRLDERAEDDKRLRAVIERYQQRIERTPTRETELASLMRDYDVLRESYRNLLTKREESQMGAELERRSVGETLRIVQPARVPSEPFSPKTQALVLGGGAVGFISVLLFGALREFFDRTLRTDQEVQATLDLNVLALVPTIVTPQEISRRRWWTVCLIGLGSAGVAAFLYLGLG